MNLKKASMLDTIRDASPGSGTNTTYYPLRYLLSTRHMRCILRLLSHDEEGVTFAFIVAAMVANLRLPCKRGPVVVSQGT